MFSQGLIKLDRNILDWRWYKDNHTFKLFIHLILTVNYKDGGYRDIIIKRGQRVTSYAALATETGLSVRNIRTAFKHLISSGTITQEQKSKYTVITVNGYDVSDDGNVIVVPFENDNSFSRNCYKSSVSCGVYRYVYKGEVIYIGKSDRGVDNRIKSHSKEERFQPFIEECEIDYAELSNPAMTTIYETYLINKYKPRLNVAMKYTDDVPFDLPELDWQRYEVSQEM